MDGQPGYDSIQGLQGEHVLQEERSLPSPLGSEIDIYLS
jgi:hypothetical protein